MDLLPLEIDGKRVYVGFWKRFWSIWIDGLVLLPFIFLFAWLEGFNRTLAVILVIPSTALFSFYSIYFNARFGGTLGKLAVGIRITRPDGEKIGWKEAWLRSSVDLVFAAGMLVITIWALLLVDPGEFTSAGFLQRQRLLQVHFPVWYQVVIIGQNAWVWSEVVVLLLNRRKRALHDFIAGTVVIRKEFVGIMSRAGLPGPSIEPARRSRLNIALNAICIGVVIIFGLVILLYSILSASLTRVRDCPPPDTSAFVVERLSIPDAENAFTYFQAATNSLCWPTNSDIVLDILDETKNDTDYKGLIHDLIANNDDTIAIVKEGLECRVCQAPEITSLDDLIPPLAKWRNIARLMALKARVERQEGQFARSAQSCLDLIRFGNLIQADAESIIQYLIGIAVLNIGFEQCRHLAGAPGVDGSLLIELSDRIGQLDPFDRGLIRAFKAELPNLDGVLKRKCNLECSAAATRLILACKAYKISRNELPDRLESLVPKYIDSIPLDPHDGQPFKYSKSKAIVYSVGKDLKDAGGSIELPADAKLIGDSDRQWKTEDIVFNIEKTPE